MSINYPENVPLVGANYLCIKSCLHLCWKDSEATLQSLKGKKIHVRTNVNTDRDLHGLL